jgi:Flp pilus assembly protein TadG
MRRIKSFTRGRFTCESGQSLLEASLTLPVLILMMAYAVDFGYFFVVASSLTTTARVATEYSVAGNASAAQASLPQTGISSATPNTVSNLALSDVAQLAHSTTGTSVQVCGKQLGTTGNVTNCGQYGASNSVTYTPQADPEAGTIYMNRVDVTYTVQPPIPLSIFKQSLLPPLTLHRAVMMRVMD